MASVDTATATDAPKVVKTAYPLAVDLANYPEPIGAYVTGGMEAIEGWGVDPFLARLFLLLDSFQREYGIGGNLFEIGVHHGRSAVLLALLTREDETAVFLDLFERQTENIDSSGRGDREAFEANLETWAPDRRVEIIQGNSLEVDLTAIPALKAGVRFAHIDGAHHRAAVLNDLAKTQPHVCEGGVVVMDDFMHSGFPGVNEACNYYLEQRYGALLAPVALGHNKLILTPRASQEPLRAYLAAHLRPPIGGEVIYHDYRALCLDQH